MLPLSQGKRSAEISKLGARKDRRDRGASISVTGSPGWVDEPPSSLSFKHVFVVLGLVGLTARDKRVQILVSVLAVAG